MNLNGRLAHLEAQHAEQRKARRRALFAEWKRWLADNATVAERAALTRAVVHSFEGAAWLQANCSEPERVRAYVGELGPADVEMPSRILERAPADLMRRLWEA